MASSSGEVGAEGIARARCLAKASTCLNTSELRDLAIGCEAAKEVLPQAFTDVLRAASGGPVLTTKS
eukprot:1311543-Lingulodinium_polyedra.AAC.1